MNHAQLFKDIKKLEEKYSLSYQEILKIIEKREATIPLSVFNEKLGSLESIVKYLRENKGMSLKQISILTQKKIQPIRTTYNRSKKKHPGKLSLQKGKQFPVHILQNSTHSVLENIVSYLLDENYTLQEISLVLQRGYKTIWTIKDRLQRRKARKL